MNQSLKNIVGAAAAVLTVVLAISVGYYVYYYGKSIQPAAYRSFSVNGEGKVTAVPDIAHFTFSVITEGKDLAALQIENTNKVNKAIDFLKKNGVESKDISTQNYNVNPQYQYVNCAPDKPCPPPSIVGYSIRQTVSVKARNFEKIGNLLTGIVQNGANEVSQLDFTIDEPTELRAQARLIAIQRAKDQAQSIAKAGGFTLGKLLSIEENGSTPVPMPTYFSKDAAMGGGVPEAAPAPSIEPGSQEITSTVTLRYEIK